MNIDYIGRNYEIDDRVRAYTETKLGKLAKFLQEPVEIRVTLETEKHRQIAEVHVHHRLGVLQATEETGDMYDAINMAVDKVEKQARRSTRKLIDRRRRAGRTNGRQQHWPLAVVERASVGAGGPPRVIRNTRLQIKPMSIEEAALQLDGAKNDFVVFRDATSDRISVLYKRKDDNYGLIAPDF
jgi:putative sigma-54 modulation protein